MPLYRVLKQRHSAKYIFAECQKKALGKDAFCRVPKNSTRQNTYLPSARKKALDKDAFCRVFFLPSVFYLALGKDRLCRVPNKTHSAKPPALGKVPVSGSAIWGSLVEHTCPSTLSWWWVATLIHCTCLHTRKKDCIHRRSTASQFICNHLIGKWWRSAGIQCTRVWDMND